VNNLSQETIARILSIERDAADLHAGAERQAADLIAEAKDAVAAMQEHTLAQARREAENIVTRGREAAEAERARIIAQAETEAQRIEALAERHFDRAVRYVLDQVAGHE
jgi:vacuolar-type H+-ATPase subunit H